MRTFIALEPPQGFVDDVAALSRQLSAHVSGRFLPRSTYHVTLAFLGEVDERGLECAVGALEEACRGCGPVPLRGVELGSFGRARDATLWLGLAPDPELLGLADRTRAELRARGVDFDAKPFKAHLTIARRADLSGGRLPMPQLPAPAQAGEVVLFKSTLQRSGAVYKPLHTVELGR